jgi:hypothetical protein
LFLKPEFVPWEVLFGDEDKKTLDASVFQDEPSNTPDELQNLFKADKEANVPVNFKEQIADIYKKIQAKQAEEATQQETAKQQPSVDEQKKIFEGRAKRWAPAVDAAVADKLAGRLKPLNDPEPGVVGESQKGGLHEYFGAGWANTDLNNIDALRKALGVASYSPPDEVIDALQKQPVSQRLYALTAEGAEFEDKSWASLSELFSNTRLGVLPDERIESAIASFEGYPGAENLSNAEKAALYFYTRSSWTDAVNSYLRKLDGASVTLMKQKARGGDTEYVERKLKLLMTDPSFKQTRQVATLMMNGLAKLIAARQAHGGKPLMATRGAGGDTFSRVGEQDAVYDAAFMSTANMPSHMSEFSNNAKVNMVLFSNQGVDVAPFSGYSHEKEILMFPGTMFNVDMMLEPGDDQLLVLRELVDGEPIDAASLRPQEQKAETGVGWAIENTGRRYKSPVIEKALGAKADEGAMQRQVVRLKKLLARIEQGTIAPGGIQQGGADYMDLKHLVDSIGDQPEWQSSVPGLEEFLLNSEIGSQGIDIDIINAYVDGQLGRKLVDWAATKKGDVSAREMELLLLADTLSSARNSFFKNLYDYSDGKRNLVIERAIAKALTRPGQQNAEARQWWGETIEQYADAVGANVQSLPLEWQQLVSEARPPSQIQPQGYF